MADNRNISPEEDDYSADVSALIERGAHIDGNVRSSNEWRKDAYLTFNRSNLVSIDDLVTMRRSDGQARELGNLVTLPIWLSMFQGRWVAPDGESAEDEVEFANLMWTLPPALGGMTTPRSHVLNQIGLAITDGFAPFELVSHIPDVGPLKGKVTLRKMAYRDPRTVTILQDERGGYAGFRQVTNVAGKRVDVSLSPKKTALFTVNGHENPLYGVSFFEAAYPHYMSKLKWYYISEQAGQIAAVPGRVGEIPRGAKTEDVRAFMHSLENYFFNATVVHKQGYKVTPFASTPGFNFIENIDHHNLMMSKSVLASFIENHQRTVLVENSTEDASADLFLLSMEALTNNLAEVLTHHVMPKYIERNFPGSTAYPVFKPGPLSDSAKKKIGALFDRVVVSGILNSTPEMVRALEKRVSNELGLDVDYEDIEEREAEAAQRQQEQAEMLAEQAQMESIEEERAQDGGIPNSPDPTSGPIDQGSVETPQPSDDDASMSDDAEFSLQDMLDYAKRIYQDDMHAVDEGMIDFD